MAQHTVQFGIPTCSLGKADVTFDVSRNGSKFGTVTVSNGSVVWFPKDVTYGYRMDWARLDKMISEAGLKQVEKRK